MQLLCNPMDCSPPGFSAHGVSQARRLGWVAISSSGGSSRPRDWSHISCIYCTGRQMLYNWERRLVEGSIFRDWYESDEYPKKIRNWARLYEESSWKMLNTHHTQHLLGDARFSLTSLVSDENASFSKLSWPLHSFDYSSSRRGMALSGCRVGISSSSGLTFQRSLGASWPGLHVPHLTGTDNPPPPESISLGLVSAVKVLEVYGSFWGCW